MHPVRQQPFALQVREAGQDPVVQLVPLHCFVPVRPRGAPAPGTRKILYVTL
jgi:hypothetical protein